MVTRTGSQNIDLLNVFILIKINEFFRDLSAVLDNAAQHNRCLADIVIHI